MIQVDLPAAFAIGQTFALLSKKYLQQEPNLFTSKLLGPFNIYLSCGFVPGGLFLLVGWPAWEAMYTVQWIENSYNNPIVAAIYVLFVIAMILLGNIGYILGHYWYKTKRDAFVIGGIIAGIFLTALPFILKWGCWKHIGTFTEIQTGSGYPFGEPPFFKGWLGIMSYLFAVGILSGLWFRAKSRKLAKQ